MRIDRRAAPAASRRPPSRTASTGLPRETVAGPIAKEPCRRIERRTLWNEAPGRETLEGYRDRTPVPNDFSAPEDRRLRPSSCRPVPTVKYKWRTP